MASLIRSRYEQYKRDTQQFTTWLAQTAITLGYPLSNFDCRNSEDAEDVPTTKSKKNAKKKARAKEKVKLAREGVDEVEIGRDCEDSSESQAIDLKKEKGVPGKTQSEFRPLPDVRTELIAVDALDEIAPDLAGRYSLKLSLYPEVAQYIVDQGASIPVEVIRILKRCITLRLKASRRFVATSDPSNESHRFFIDILIKVRGVLDTMNPRVDPKDPVRISNQFSGLAVDNLDEEENAEDLPDIQLPGVGSSTSRSTFEPEISIAEAINAVMIFLGDMENTRIYIMDLWRDYKLGMVDLVTAAVTTNTALELLERPHASLMQRVMPTFNHDFTTMICAIFSIFRGREAGQSDAIPLFNQVDDKDLELGLIYDFLMLPFTQSLVGLAKLIDNETVPIYNGVMGYYDPTTALDKLSFRQRWHQYQLLLAESFTDIFFLLGLGNPASDYNLGQGFPVLGSPQGANLFFVDRTLELMDTFIRTKEISFHLTFALRILLDISLSLGPTTNRGIRLLRDTATRIVKTLESRSTCEGPDPPADWDARNEIVIAKFLHEASWFADFDVRRLRNVPGMGDARWLLVERDPLLCGLLLFRLQMLYQDIGFKLANTWGSILYAGHLYEACRISGSGEDKLPSWPDMELVLEIHGKEQSFGGKIPTTIDESYTAFLIIAGYSTGTVQALGTALTEAASRYRSPRNPELMSKSGPRPFQDQNKILPIYRRKYTVDVTTGLQYDITAIEALLKDLRATEAKKSITLTTGVGRKGFRKEKRHRAAKFSLTQLLSILEKGLQLETRSIRFDYVSMHLRCLRIYRSIKTVSHPYLIGKLGPAYIDNDSQLPFITAWTLHIAALALRSGELSMGIKRDSGVTKSRLLLGATAEFRKALSSKDSGREETLKVERDSQR